MVEGKSSFWTKFKRPRVFIPTLAGLIVLGGVASYLILLNPSSIFVRWAQVAFPERITMITIGPYPGEKDFQRLKKERVKYIVSLLDPRIPYDKALIEREKILADKYGMTLKVFPMASIFDRKLFSDYLEQQGKAVEFLKNLDGPAYVHCYLGKHRTLHVRDALMKGGMPERYWTTAASDEHYWEIARRVVEAQREFHQGNFAKVLELLQSLTAKDDSPVAYLRGWSYYRLGRILEATENFRQGLELDPTDRGVMNGLGYCYLKAGQPVMAHHQFSAVLELYPDDPDALVGLGLAYLETQNKAGAVETFRKVLQLHPENEEVKGYLKQAEAR